MSREHLEQTGRRSFSSPGRYSSRRATGDFRPLLKRLLGGRAAGLSPTDINCDRLA
jgi:hypothetical protein